MHYRDILVPAQAGPKADIELQIAGDLAARMDATLVGVFVKPPFLVAPVGVDGMVAPDVLARLTEDHVERVEAETEDARTRFQAAAAAAGASCEWLVAEGEAPDDFLRLARLADLLVYPMAGLDHTGFSAADITFATGGPVLLTPSAPASLTIGRNVLLAWNGGREASSALRNAEPMLEAADRVAAVLIAPPPLAEQQLNRHLTHHGIKADIYVDHSEDRNAGQVIRNEAEQRACDLVVMGLFGHSRLREMVLGGASKTMLSQQTIPLLTAH
jgi:nucleotide-binding universal stress UspA family protein